MTESLDGRSISRTLWVAFLLAVPLLGGVLWLELTRPLVHVDRFSTPALARTRPTAIAAAPPAQIVGWTVAILGRPLFSPQRRLSADNKPSPHHERSFPRLSGVVVAQGATAAIFAKPGKKPILVRIGERVGPYVVDSIAAGRVTVSGPSGKVVLQPQFTKQSNGKQPAAGVTSPEVVPRPALPAQSPSSPATTRPLPMPDFVRGIFAEQSKALTQQQSNPK